jgi:hypothetical protein
MHTGSVVLDEIRFFSRALLAADVLADYQTVSFSMINL